MYELICKLYSQTIQLLCAWVLNRVNKFTFLYTMQNLSEHRDITGLVVGPPSMLQSIDMHGVYSPQPRSIGQKLLFEEKMFLTHSNERTVKFKRTMSSCI